MPSDPSSSRPTPESIRELAAKLEGLRELVLAKFEGLERTIAAHDERYDERDERYRERDDANKASVKSALIAAEKAGEKTEQSLKEYKTGANEWRDTVKDLVARMPSKTEVDKDINALVDKINVLRDTVTAGRGQREGGKLLKDESRANVALVLAMVGSLVGIIGLIFALRR